MADSYHIAQFEEFEAWDTFVRQSDTSSIFSLYGWLECARETSGGQVRCYGCYKNGQLVAGVSGIERRLGMWRQFATPMLTPHGGLIYAPAASANAVRAEAEHSKAAQLIVEHIGREYDYAELSLEPEISDVREFTWAGWKSRVRYTFRVDLKEPDVIWQGLEGRTRTAIRKAEKLGFQVGQTDDVDLFRHQLALVQGREHNEQWVDPSLVQRFSSRAVKAGFVQLYSVVSTSGAVAAMVAQVRGMSKAYSWQSGADPAFNHTGALALLYWKLFAESEFDSFDLVGANIPAVAFFKRGFGGQLIPYFVVNGYRSAFTKAAVTGRNLLRRFF